MIWLTRVIYLFVMGLTLACVACIDDDGKFLMLGERTWERMNDNIGGILKPGEVFDELPGGTHVAADVKTFPFEPGIGETKSKFTQRTSRGSNHLDPRYIATVRDR